MWNIYKNGAPVALSIYARPPGGGNIKDYKISYNGKTSCYIDGLAAQDCGNSSALAMELPQYCVKLPISSS